MSSQYLTDNYVSAADAADYSELSNYEVAIPKAPQALAYNMPRDYAPYIVHSANKNVYVQNMIPTYNDLTGTGLTDYNRISQQIYRNNAQPVENITPLPGRQKGLNYAQFTDARLNMGPKAY